MARAASVYSCRASSVLTSVGRERATSTMIFRVMRPVGLLPIRVGVVINSLAIAFRCNLAACYVSWTQDVT